MTALRVMLFLAAAGVGGIVRWRIGGWLQSTTGFGWGTIVVNITGSFALGVLHGVDDAVATIVGIGALGALTTFSSFVKELVEEIQSASWLRAAAYGVLSLGGSVAAASLGLQL